MKRLLAMWDMLGLECVYDVDQALAEITDWEKEKMWSMLREEPVGSMPSPIPLRAMILRARFNSQRKYEIYEFESELSQEEVQSLFNSEPQFIVDWIRKNGYKIYSDYSLAQNDQVIR
jgi:hypothetical protein